MRRIVLAAANSVFALGLAWTFLPRDTDREDLQPSGIAAAPVSPPEDVIGRAEPTGDVFRAGTETPAPVVAETPEPSKLRLIGVIDGPQLNLAVLQNGEDAQLIRVRLGDKVEQWSVEEIGRKSVTLEGNGVRTILVLDAQEPAAAERQNAEAGAPTAAFSIAPGSIIQRIKR